MDTKPPGKSRGREVVERAAEAGAGMVPVVGPVLAVALVTVLNWRLNDRREEWFAQLAEDVEALKQRHEDLDLEDLAANPLFVDAVVSATRTVEHTSQEEKIGALRNAVLNSVGPDAPDADTQAIMLNLVDRYTPSHLRLLTLWDDPAAWFERHGVTAPAVAMSGSRTQTVEAGLPEMRGRRDFYMLITRELESDGLLVPTVPGMVSTSSLTNRLTTELGRQFLRFISHPD